MQKTLHVFVGTVYPRYADMHAERMQRLQEHNARISVLHEHLSGKCDVIITNPLNESARRTSDMFPSIGSMNLPEISDDLKAMLKSERQQEMIRRDLWSIRQADLAIIDLTYLENNPEIVTLVNEADLLDIPTLFIRFGEQTSAPQQSVAKKRRFVACYTCDFEIRALVNDAIEMLFPYSRREDETNPQIPSKILTFQKKGA